MLAVRRLAQSGHRALGGARWSNAFHATGTANQDTIEVTIDGNPVQVAKGSSVLQACDAAGIDIPRFCYHQRLSIAGNCRMCLVEVEKVPKPVASCAMPAGPGMNIKTNTPLVKKAREGVMEFLLANHPLDCPICDQGGECDLQDQAMLFGSDRGRFTEYKRSVEDKELGPLVKTVMTRCIHCTRCVRFAKEIAGVEDLGVTGRGRDAEIGTYVEKMMVSELSANVVDICPVGALTAKPNAFTYRSWELKATESVDVADALGSAITIDSRGTEVLRITPRLNEDINEEWLSDRARFQFDGLKRQRLNVPMVRGPKGLAPSTWEEALTKVAEAAEGVSGAEMKAVAGKLADAESITALKDLMNRLGCGNLASEAGFADMDADLRSSYLMNSTVAGLEEADAILLVGTNPRIEAPVLNARIRKAVRLNGTSVGNVGAAVDLTYKHTELGAGASALEELAAGKGAFAEALKSAKRPVVIVGTGALSRPDRTAVLEKLHKIAESYGVVSGDWMGYNVMHDSASRVAALDLGFRPSAAALEKPTAPKLVYLLGADDYAEEDVPAGAFVVYQGHHGDRGAERADVVLPGAAYTEKAATYVNTEGRAQTTVPAVPTVGEARDDWKILRALSEVLGVGLPYDSLEGVRTRMAEIAPNLVSCGNVESATWLNGDAFAHLPKGGKADAAPFESAVKNYYMTDSISRASKTMAKCISALGK